MLHSQLIGVSHNVSSTAIYLEVLGPSSIAGIMKSLVSFL